MADAVILNSDLTYKFGTGKGVFDYSRVIGILHSTRAHVEISDITAAAAGIEIVGVNVHLFQDDTAAGKLPFAENLSILEIFLISVHTHTHTYAIGGVDIDNDIKIGYLHVRYVSLTRKGTFAFNLEAGREFRAHGNGNGSGDIVLRRTDSQRNLSFGSATGRGIDNTYTRFLTVDIQFLTFCKIEAIVLGVGILIFHLEDFSAP